jgi:hypothetical protein
LPVSLDIFTGKTIARQEGRNQKSTKTKNRMLIADDEPDITESFGLSLEDSGFEVDKYNDPAVALASFKPNVYDLDPGYKDAQNGRF